MRAIGAMGWLNNPSPALKEHYSRGKDMDVAQNLNTYEFNGTRNLSAEQFWTLVDRAQRNDLLDFEKKCRHRDDDELVAILRHWQGQDGKRAALFAAIARAEIKDRLRAAGHPHLRKPGWLW